MSGKDTTNPDDLSLRLVAEARLLAAPLLDTSGCSVDTLLHELQVHQIELEMQNENLRQSQIELEEARDRYVNSYEFAPVGYLTLNREGLVVEANLTCASLLNDMRSNLLGHRLDSRVVAQDIERWRRYFTILWQAGQQSSCEVQLKRGDGTFVPVLLTTTGATDETQLVVHMALINIAERNIADEKLRVSENRFMQLFMLVPIPLGVVNKAGSILHFNEKFTSVFGYTVNDLPTLDEYWKQVYPDVSYRAWVVDIWWAAITKAAKEKADIVPAEFKMTCKNGLERTVMIGGVFLEENILAIFLDITEQKRMEKVNVDAGIHLKHVLTDAIGAIASTLEQRDPYTAGHQRRVSELAAAIGMEMGIAGEMIEGIYFGGLVHDIGKISVPAEILGKPGHLNDIEFGLIMSHSEDGYKILKDIALPWPVAEMVRQHHERMDGSGYPRRLYGEQIIMEARILAVADVVEAMSADRPYRPGLGMDAALAEITRWRATHFDATVVDACLTLIMSKGFVFTK